MDCFHQISILHFRDNEGYTDDWYDYTDEIPGWEENSLTGYIYYTVDIPEDAQITTDDALYFTLETYYGNMVPKECTNGTS